jgi:hypothetical protein
MNRERSKMETPARSAKVGVGVAQVVGPAERLDPGGELGWSPLARAEVVQVSPSSGAGNRSELSDRGRRSSASNAAFGQVDVDQLPGDGPVEHLPQRLGRLEAMPLWQVAAPGRSPLSADQPAAPRRKQRSPSPRASAACRSSPAPPDAPPGTAPPAPPGSSSHADGADRVSAEAPAAPRFASRTRPPARFEQCPLTR